MRIAIGCDDTGFPLKEPLVAALEAEGHDVLDLGTFSTDPVDYPDYARAVGQAVLRGFVDASLLLCGSGAGGVIAANKMRGIRAALCHDATEILPHRNAGEGKQRIGLLLRRDTYENHEYRSKDRRGEQRL